MNTNYALAQLIQKDRAPKGAPYANLRIHLKNWPKKGKRK